MKQKQIILQNNIIDCYKKLKNDKEKSLFLLKIFKFLVENEEIITKNPLIEGMFLGIKPSLKIKEFDVNWGGKREGSGRKTNGSDNSSLNQDEKQDDNQDDNQDEKKFDNQDFSSSLSIKDIKNESNKELKNESNKEKEKEKDDFITYEYCKQIYTKANCYEFNIVKFFNYYKDKGIKKEQVEHLMNQWDMRENQFKQQSQKKDEKTSVDTFFKQLGVSEQDLKEFGDFKKRSENA